MYIDYRKYRILLAENASLLDKDSKNFRGGALDPPLTPPPRLATLARSSPTPPGSRNVALFQEIQVIFGSLEF